MAKTGKTTGNLKMRSGPGMQFEPPIAYLVPDTALEILDEQGDWLHVRAAGKEGYVGRKYVAISETPSLSGTGGIQQDAPGPVLGSAGEIKQSGLGRAGDIKVGGMGRSGGQIKPGKPGQAGGPVKGSKSAPDVGKRKGLDKK